MEREHAISALQAAESFQSFCCSRNVYKAFGDLESDPTKGFRATKSVYLQLLTVSKLVLLTEYMERVYQPGSARCRVPDLWTTNESEFDLNWINLSNLP